MGASPGLGLCSQPRATQQISQLWAPGQHSRVYSETSLGVATGRKGQAARGGARVEQRIRTCPLPQAIAASRSPLFSPLAGHENAGQGAEQRRKVNRELGGRSRRRKIPKMHSK